MNTLGVPPSPQTGGTMGKGAEIKEENNRGEGMVDTDRAEKNGGEREKRKAEA